MDLPPTFQSNEANDSTFLEQDQDAEDVLPRVYNMNEFLPEEAKDDEAAAVTCISDKNKPLRFVIIQRITDKTDIPGKWSARTVLMILLTT